MTHVSELRLARHHRTGSAATTVAAGVAFATPRDTLDFVVDGYSLLEHAPDDVVSCLGWDGPEWEADVVAKLLLERPSDFPDGRYALLICPECGDLSCGAVSCVIEREGTTIVWRDFAWQNDYEDGPQHHARYAHLGPYRFAFAQYAAALRTAIGEPGAPAV